MTPKKNVEGTEPSSQIQAANCDFISPSVYEDSAYKGKLTIPVFEYILIYNFQLI